MAQCYAQGLCPYWTFEGLLYIPYPFKMYTYPLKDTITVQHFFFLAKLHHRMLGKTQKVQGGLLDSVTMLISHDSVRTDQRAD